MSLLKCFRYDVNEVITIIKYTEAVMKIKLFIAPILALALVTGCSAKAPEATESAVKTEVQTQVNETYSYTDEAGRTINLDKAPEKVAATYLPLWESLILLDVQPVGVSGAENYLKTWDPFQGKSLGTVADLGSKEVNLELLTQLEPDLILEQAYDLSSYDITNLEKISKVAVFGPKSKMDWKYNLREVAKAVHKEEKAETVIQEVEAKLHASREKLSGTYSDKKVMQMSLMAVDKFFITYRPELYDKTTGLGLTPPEGFTKEAKYTQISMEALAEMNPDVIFVNVFDGDEGIFDTFQQNPVWKNLNAVKNGKVYRLDGSGHALSAMSTIYTVDKIVETLLGQ